MKNKKNVFRFTLGLLAASAFVFPAGTFYAESGNIPTGTTSNIASGSSSSSTSRTNRASGSSSRSASDSSSKGTISNEDDYYGVVAMPKSSEVGNKGLIEDGVTTQDIGDRVTSKGYSLVDMLRQWCVPICIGAFIVGAIMAIFGALSKKATVMPGVWAMIVSGIGFALIYNAPYIMAWFGNFFNA